MNKWWIFLWGILFLSGCAPQYETRYEFMPTSSTAGLGCLKGCQAQTQQCNLQCSQQFAQCGSKAEQQAQQTLPGKLQDYAVELTTWQNAQNRYEMDQRFYEMALHQHELERDVQRLTCEKEGKDSPACQHHHALLLGMPALNEPSSPGNSPEKPTLASETARIRDLTCNNECKCDEQYRQCYTSCGGAVKPYQFCVQNCPTR